MTIGECGQVEKVVFWPAEELEIVFKQINAAIGKENEIAEMRLFVRAMNYFYERAEIINGELDKQDMSELCRLAQKGLFAELGIDPLTDEESV